MGFLNKLKKSVSDAGTIAKVTVEVNRLKLQVSSIKKDISELQTSIGKLIYDQYSNSAENMDEIKSICEQIKDKYDEIDVIQQKIIEINGEKKCECGSTVPAETRFCSQCGHHFNDDEVLSPKINEASAVEPLVLENRLEEEAATLACKECDQPIEEDAKFCEHCGTSTDSV